MGAAETGEHAKEKKKLQLAYRFSITLLRRKYNIMRVKYLFLSFFNFIYFVDLSFEMGREFLYKENLQRSEKRK